MDNIRLKELEDWFSAYCKSFDDGNAESKKNYDLKELHSRKVRENIRLLGESAGLVNDRLALAESIGLLHDVGRFEQYRRYKTFLDSKSVNHAALGVEVIREKGLTLDEAKETADILIQSIRFHNVFSIPASSTGEQLLYLKLIRDADKLDIWRVFIDYFLLPDGERASAAGLGFPDSSDCSLEVLESLKQEKMVHLTELKTLNDFKLLQISWVYDINFPLSFQIIKEQGHLYRLAATLPETPEVEHALKKVWRYLEKHQG